METRKFQALRHCAKAAFACFTVISITAMLTACAPAPWMPRIQGQLEAELAPNSCELQLTEAEDASAMAAAHSGAVRGAESLTIWQRQLKATQARDAWRSVAVTCQGRFAEGVLESGRASFMAAALARRAGIPYVDTVTTVNERTAITLANDTAGNMALAHDRAGFAYEVLAARHNANATLARLSDRHKTLASGFAARTPNTDSRGKIYSVQQLLANPDTILDAVSGLQAPTSAAVAMDVVREQLNVLAVSSSSSSAHSSANSSIESPSNSAQSSSGPENSETGGGSDAADTTHIVIADDGTAALLANLLAEETAQALQLGFPSFDEALFATRVASS